MMRDPSLETFSQTTSGSYGTDSYDWTTDEATSSSGAGSVVLDLTGAPQDTVKTIDVDGNIGEIEVLLRQDQPVSFDINGGVGTVSATYWTDADGSQVSSDWVPQVSAIYDSLDFRNDAWTRAGGITVDVDSTLGNVSIVEKAPASQEVTPTPKTSTPGSQSGAAQSGASSGSPTTSSSATTDDQH